MSDNQAMDEMAKLKDTLAQLTLANAVKTQQAELLEKKYAQTIVILNDYINQLHRVLNMKTGEEAESISIEKLMSVLTKDDLLQTEEFIIIPKKLIKEHKIKEVNSATHPIAGAQEKFTSTQTLPKPTAGPKKMSRRPKSKMTCSHCNEGGHKRSQCPKILYKEV